MKYSEFIIDLNDIYGRFIPGLILIGDLFFLLKFFNPVLYNGLLDKAQQIINPTSINNPSGTTLILTILIVALGLSATIVGEVPLYLIFKFKPLILRGRLSKWLPENFPDMDKFKKYIKSDILNAKEFDNHLVYFKLYLLKNVPEVYAQARRLEAKINLYGGLVIPSGLTILIPWLAGEPPWFWTFIFASLMIIFFLEFLQSLKWEVNFILITYLNCQTPVTTNDV